MENLHGRCPIMKNISPLYKFSLKGGGWDEQRQPKMQPSAEIVRVECAKCRRKCDLSGVRATLCGDRACRVREMQARVRFGPFLRNPLRRSCVSSARNAGETAIFKKLPRNPLRRSCVSSARNAGESAIGSVRAQPSAEIVRVERRDSSWTRETLCGDRAFVVQL